MSEEADSGSELMHAYLDTNAFLEFRPPRDLDWNNLLKEKHVVLVVSPVVIEELQRIKDGAVRDMPRRKRQRAGDILKTLERDLFPDDAQPVTVVRLNDGVGLKFDSGAIPSAVFTDNSLDQNLADARLVAAVITARNAGHRVCLVSNDAGPRWQAKSRNVRAFDLPDDWRVKDEPDAAEVELRETKKKLLVFESRAPKLNLRTKAGDTFARRELPRPRVPIAKHVEAHMESLRSLYGHYGHDFGAGVGGPSRGFLLEAPARGQIERYNKGIDAFLVKAEQALPKIIAFRNELDLNVLLDGIVLANDGTHPAEEVSVVLRAPSTVTLALGLPSKRPEFPDPPRPPKGRFDSFGVMAELPTTLSPSVISHLFQRSPVSLAPEWEVEGSEAEISIGTVRHHGQEVLPPLWLQLDSYDNAVGFGLDYELHAYNIPNPVTGRFHIQVPKGTRMSPLDLERWNAGDLESDGEDDEAPVDDDDE